MAGLFRQGDIPQAFFMGGAPVVGVYIGKFRMWPMDMLSPETGMFVLTGEGTALDLTPSYDRRALAGDETGRRRLAGDESGYRRVNA